MSMDRERTSRQWIFDATTYLGHVTNAKRRFSVSLAFSEITALAASDELGAAARDATAWMAAHPCPDIELGSRVDLMLETCADVARTAQQAITHPAGNVESVRSHLNDLLVIIEVHAHALDRW